MLKNTFILIFSLAIILLMLSDCSKKGSGNVYKNGTFTGSAYGYAGPITVQVTIKNDRIIDVKVTNHHEDIPKDAITQIPMKILQAQNTRDVDVVTGATKTSNAILDAAAIAINSATITTAGNKDSFRRY
jgi:NosR/NirI family transcriptional regulator, nitrous oxide reductase regulator